jgi:hypothetical protein
VHSETMRPRTRASRVSSSTRRMSTCLSPMPKGPDMQFCLEAREVEAGINGCARFARTTKPKTPLNHYHRRHLSPEPSPIRRG